LAAHRNGNLMHQRMPADLDGQIARASGWNRPERGLRRRRHAVILSLKLDSSLPLAERHEAKVLTFATNSATVSQFWPQMLVLAGILAIAFLMMIAVRKKFARRQAESVSPRERMERIRTAHTDRNDAMVVQADLTDHARTMAARLDAKAQRLEILIEQADQRIAELRSLAAGEDVSETEQIEQTLREIDAGSPQMEQLDPLTQSVYELADAGRNPVQIAKELDEQIGKVELILALRQV
jgi:hypothetical protein